MTADIDSLRERFRILGADIGGVMPLRVGPPGQRWGEEWRHDVHGGGDGGDWRGGPAW